MNNYDLIIIGGGAAGSAAAVFSAPNYGRILLIEKNSRNSAPLLLRKVGITGKGRCNLTNNCDMQTLLGNVHVNAAFLRSAFARFTPQDCMDFFESLGVPLKTERGGRVFPQSDRAADVVDSLKRAISAAGNVETIAGRVRELIITNGAVAGCGGDFGERYAPKIILATGGASYPATGSTGDGYAIAAKEGHTITPIRPALVPLETAEDCAELAGLSLKNVKLTLRAKAGKPAFARQGELLFTHFGISGPLVLTASCYYEGGDTTAEIDLKPALDEKTLDARILRDFAQNRNKRLKNVLPLLMPETLTGFFLRQSGVCGDTPVNAVTKAERAALVAALKGLTLRISGTRPIDEAVITNGGVSVREINPKTMESKLVRGLHFAGEVIDVAGFTGGFNLQIAFSTAFAACSGTESQIGEVP